jgi:hypothetical protein
LLSFSFTQLFLLLALDFKAFLVRFGFGCEVELSLLLWVTLFLSCRLHEESPSLTDISWALNGEPVISVADLALDLRLVATALTLSATGKG